MKMKRTMSTTFYHPPAHRTPAPPEASADRLTGHIDLHPVEGQWQSSYNHSAHANGWTLRVSAERTWRGWRVTATRMERTCEI